MCVILCFTAMCILVLYTSFTHIVYMQSGHLCILLIYTLECYSPNVFLRYTTEVLYIDQCRHLFLLCRQGTGYHVSVDLGSHFKPHPIHSLPHCTTILLTKSTKYDHFLISAVHNILPDLESPSTI